MKPAVFLDRDGTVIEERGYLGRLDLIELLPGSAEAIRLMKAAGYAVVIVTNQAGIARGLFDEAFVQSAHARLDAMLRESGAAVDGYYYCPHHPDGVVDRYRLVCGCRKPAPGMVLRAAAALGVPPSECALIGDTGADVGAALAAGARPVLVPNEVTRREEIAAAPEVALSIGAAVDLLLGGRT